MSPNEHHCTRSLVHFTGLNSDEAVFDHVEPTNPLSATTAIHLFDRFKYRNRPTVDSDGLTAFEGNNDLVGSISQ